MGHMVAGCDAKVSGGPGATVCSLFLAYPFVAPAVGVIETAFDGVGELGKVGRVEGEIDACYALVELSTLVGCELADCARLGVERVGGGSRLGYQVGLGQSDEGAEGSWCAVHCASNAPVVGIGHHLSQIVLVELEELCFEASLALSVVYAHLAVRACVKAEPNPNTIIHH